MDDIDLGQNDKHDQLEKDGSHIRLAEIDLDEYDALADLFLDEGAFSPEGTSGAEMPTQQQVDAEGIDSSHENDIDSELPTHETHIPVLHLTRSEEDAELGSAPPVGDDEAFHAESAGMRILETLDETDNHASDLLDALLEHESSYDQRVEVVAMPQPRMEVVVLGHLPVRATLWVRQYACSLAKEREETVALVRAAAGTTAIDLITGDQDMQSQSFSTLDRALSYISEHADRVIMRVDEASEPGLLDRPEIEEITVLTGADEAAVVASYRLMKTLDATLGERYAIDEGPMFRLAVMGAGKEQASEARTKLENAVKTFIERPIEIVVGSGRIDATGTMNLYRDSISHPALHIIDGLVQAGIQDGSSNVQAHGSASVDETKSSLEQIDEIESSGEQNNRVEVTIAPAGVRVPTAKTSAGRREKLGETSGSQTSGSQSVAVIKPEVITGRKRRKSSASAGSAIGSAISSGVGSSVESPSMRDGLCALIPGLSPIEARCPKAAGVEMAIDDQGRLHLIVCDGDTRDAMNRLLAAQTWARNNLGLLIRAEPGLAFPSNEQGSESDAMMHLISIEPRSLHEIFDTGVRVYALARVKVGDVVAQVATPIN
jgi:hypothetical protein